MTASLSSWEDLRWRAWVRVRGRGIVVGPVRSSSPPPSCCADAGWAAGVDRLAHVLEEGGGGGEERAAWVAVRVAASDLPTPPQAHIEANSPARWHAQVVPVAEQGASEAALTAVDAVASQTALVRA